MFLTTAVIVFAYFFSNHSCFICTQCANASTFSSFFPHSLACVKEANVQADAETFLLALRACPDAEQAFVCWSRLLDAKHVTLHVSCSVSFCLAKLTYLQ